MLVRHLIPCSKYQEENSVAQLYDAYSPALYSYILKIFPEKEFAEKILQTAFIKLNENPKIYNNTQCNVLLWLLNTARNEAIDLLIKKNSTIKFNKSINGLMINSEDFYSFLTSLPICDKTILCLIYLRNLSVIETAVLLGIPVDFIKIKLQQSLQKLS